MKYWKFTLLLLCCILIIRCPTDAYAEQGSTAINTANFPNANFRSYVSANFDTNGDGYLSESEKNAVEFIKVNEKKITSLVGVEHFPNLRVLWCNSNGLRALDLSHNTALQILDCECNYQLTTLDLSHNPELTYVSCFTNGMTTIDVSNNPALRELYCYQNNLTELDVSSCISLETLYCNDNQLTELDVTNNTALKALACHSNTLTTLDVSNNASLAQLSCRYNSLSSLDVSNNTALTGLDCSNNRCTITTGGAFNLSSLPGFDVTRASNWQGGTVSESTLTVTESGSVTYSYDCGNGYSATFTLNVTVDPSIHDNGVAIDAQNFPDVFFLSYVSENIDTDGDGYLSEDERNQVQTIDVQGKGIASLVGLEYFPNLQQLNCSENELTELDLSCNTDLTHLYCDFNKLAMLDVSGNNALTYLYCGFNQLTMLDVSSNSVLVHLVCYGNSLYSLDVINNLDLEYLGCENNQLTELDVSTNTSLRLLCCNGNRLTELDISHNADLNTLDCSDNYLSSLDLSNNTALKNLNCHGNNLTRIDVSNNPFLESLLCIGNQLSALDVSNNTALVYLSCSDNHNSITSDGAFDLTMLPGFDITRASNWQGGVVNGNILTVVESGDVTYTYDCGNGFSETFTLNVTVNHNAQVDGISINAENFPDDIFRSYVAETFDLDADGNLSEEERNQVQYVNVNEQNITSLAGLEYFTSIWGLDCRNNELPFLEISNNTLLTELWCSGNRLTSLDISFNSSLGLLDCSNNELTSLDLSNNTAMTVLWCLNNELSTLEVTNNTVLTRLYCSGNKLTSLNVSSNTALTYLTCYNNELTSLDLNNNTALTGLYCGNNHLTVLNISNCSDLQELNCADNYFSITCDGAFDLTTLPGFDITKASNWQGGTVSGNTLTVTESGDVTYTYDCGNGHSVTFTLDVTLDQITPPDGSVEINTESFPDTSFRSYVSENFDINGDGYLSDAERNQVQIIEVSGKSISSLVGVEYFPNLQVMNCSSNQLGTIDVSNNPSLTSFTCDGNRLNTINVSNNPSLINLSCNSNQLTTIDVSNNLSLIGFSCNNNRLTTIDVSSNPSLTSLSCSFNQLAAIDVSNNLSLTGLSCDSNQLNSLDISHNTALFSLHCSDNQLRMLDVSNSTDLLELYCENNQLTSIDVSNNTRLQTLKCANNEFSITMDGTFDLTSLPGFDVTRASSWQGGTVNENTLTVNESGTVTYTYACGNGYSATFTLNVTLNQITPPVGSVAINTESFPDAGFLSYVSENFDIDGDSYLSKNEREQVLYLGVSDRNLTSLAGLENFPNLLQLRCENNELTELDLSGNTELRSLICYNNQLMSLNVSNNTVLTNLDCSGNQLAELDASGNCALEYLVCYDNQLTVLDLSGNTALIKLTAYQNQLTMLDVSNSPDLEEVWCNNNQLAVLNLSGNTSLMTLSSFDNQLTSLDVSNSPGLEELWCDQNQLTALNVSNNTSLKTLRCNGNQLTVIDVSNNADLTVLDCGINDLTSIDVSHCPNLKELWCAGNHLTSLDVSNNPNLLVLWCGNNNLPSVDISSNTKLTNLSCSNNLYSVTTDGAFDLTALPGFDVTRASNWQGGTVSGNTLIVNESGAVTYTYDCGNGYSETFTVYVDIQEILPTPVFILPADLVSIQEEAFFGSSMQNARLGELVTSIGNRAFANCTNLKSIYIPDGCTSIARDAFSGVTGLTIYGVDGSYAEFYAGMYGFDFIAVD